MECNWIRKTKSNRCTSSKGLGDGGAPNRGPINPPMARPKSRKFYEWVKGYKMGNLLIELDPESREVKPETLEEIYLIELLRNGKIEGEIA